MALVVGAAVQIKASMDPKKSISPDFFKSRHEAYLERCRHEDPRIQQQYDEKFAIVPYEAGPGF